MNKPNITSQDYELLSAYLDDQLTPHDKALIEKRLQTDDDLQETLKAIHLTRALLRSTPYKRAPHNFTLTPEMVQKKSLPFLFPIFSFASAMAVIVLFLSIFLDTLPLPHRDSLMASEAPAAQEMVLSESSSNAAQNESEERIFKEAESDAEEPPPIILWEDSTAPDIMAEGLGGGGNQEIPSSQAPPAMIPTSQPMMAEAEPAQAEEDPMFQAMPEQEAEESAAEETIPIQRTIDTEPPQEEILEKPLEDSGPILGIQPTQSKTIITQTTETQPEIKTTRLTGKQILQICAASTAIIFGLLAFMLWRKARL